jgi:DUF4097 and DUF4098 domain-containing protein YvlB
MYRRRALIALAVCAFAPANGARAQEPARHTSVDLSGLDQVTRPVSNTYPVSGPARIFVSNQFGTVRVVPWGEQIVRVTAEIRVGAETTAMAERFAQRVEVTGNHVGDRIEVQTKYPPAEPPAKVGYETNIEINVPASASVEIVNTFGDVFVRGLKGDLSVDARFSIVDLRDLSGTVRVRTRGQSTLVAEDLHAGGVFVLRSTEASFTRVSGDLKVDNYLGGVTLRPGSAPLRLDARCESGPIQLYLDRGAPPDLTAMADSGAIHSDLALNSETWGNTTTARNPNPDAPQHMELFTSFADIHVHQEALVAVAEPLVPPNGAPITETTTHEFDLPPGSALRLNLMPGKVVVEGHDGPRVEVTENKFVRVTDVSKAQLAVEALALRADPSTDYLGITTAVQDDMQAIGCTEYRLDLVIRVPRSAAITIRAQDGETRLTGLNGPVALEQEKGRVLLQNTQGGATVNLKQGDIESTATAGALDLSAGGQVTVRQSLGGVRVQSAGGNTLVDTPSGAVYARSRGGDVRLIALEGVRGDYDIAAEDGNISLAVPDSADAYFALNVYKGNFFSTVPLNGTSERDTHTFQGRLNAGTHRILLESRRGNVVID